MAYLSCGRCGLQIKIQAADLRIENCPRCLARSATVMPLKLSQNRVIAAGGWGMPASDQRDPRGFSRQSARWTEADEHGD